MNKPMDLNARIFVAGHRGMVGSALLRRLQSAGATNLLTTTRNELDLANQASVDGFFARERPEYVFLAAAKVGGILANSKHPAEFIQQNVAIQSNVIHSAWKHGCRKLLFLGSSCIYPRNCPQPIREEYLLTGPLEQTNEAYAVAKIVGLKMCQAYFIQYGFDSVCAMPTNLYGPGDNYHPEQSHVVAALIRRICEAVRDDADEIVIWGSGRPLREFLHVDDLADALVLLMEQCGGAEVVNVGSGQEVSIASLARTIASIAGYEGKLVFDTDKPDGTPRKRLDTRRLEGLGWRARTDLADGLQRAVFTYMSL